MKCRPVLFFASALLLCACTEPDRYVRIQGYAQGGTYSVTLNLRGVRMAPEAVRAGVDSILQVIDTTLSGYNRGSQLSRFNRGEAIRPNALFLDMYRDAYRWYERTEGAVDCAAGPLFDAWGFGFKKDSLPGPETVSALFARCGMKLLPPELSPAEDGTLRSPEGGVLNYNAIAQGSSCDLVAAWLDGIGVRDMLVDIGEIWCRGVNPDGRPWSVGIDRPVDGNDAPGADLEAVLTSEGKPCGIVTSGNYRKFYVRDGRKYAHTIDPRTGYPAGNSLLSATVVARAEEGAAYPGTGATADAVATWCMVVGLERAQEILSSTPGLAGYLVYAAEDGSMRDWASPGFPLRPR